MGMEFDRSTIDILFDNAPEIGSTIIEMATLDFWGESTEAANIKTGNLRSSIQYDIGEGQGIVGTNLEYAPYVHEGFPAHDIYPVGMVSYLGATIRSGKQALYWEGADHPVPKVHHPGYGGNPFFKDTIPIIEGRSDEYLSLTMNILGFD